MFGTKHLVQLNIRIGCHKVCQLSKSQNSSFTTAGCRGEILWKSDEEIDGQAEKKAASHSLLV